MNRYDRMSEWETYGLIENVRSSLRIIRGSKLITNASVYVLGSMLQKAAAFLLIPLYTRHLSPSEYGIVGLAQSIQGMLSLLIGLGLFSALARLYYDYRDKPNVLRSYITSTFLFLAIIGLVATLALNRWGSVLWERFSGGQVPFAPYIQMALWLAYVDNLFRIPVTLYRTAQRAKAFIAANFGVFLVSTAAIIYFVVGKKMGAKGLLLGDLIANGLAVTVLVGLLFRQYFSPVFNWEHIRSSLSFGLPLVPHAVASWALVAIDRILLESGGVSLAQIGYYNLGYQLGLVMSLLVFSINQAWSPYYYDLMKTVPNPEDKIRKMIYLYIALIGGICLIGILFSNELVTLVAPDRYKDAVVFVSPILFGHLLLGFYYLASVPLFYFKRTIVIPFITLSGAALNIILNLWWIPEWGAMGSAWATAVSYGVTFIIAFAISQRHQRIDIPLSKFATLIGLILAAVVLTTTVFSEYGDGLNSMIYLLVKFCILLLFSFLAMAWFIKPFMHQKFSSV